MRPAPLQLHCEEDIMKHPEDSVAFLRTTAGVGPGSGLVRMTR